MPAAQNGLARVGLTAKGVLYALLAVLALQIALGSGAEADSQGALKAVAQRPFGTALLAALGLGFVGYAGWQARCAVTADEAFPRVAAAVRTIVWSGLAFAAARYVFAAGARANVEKSMTARLLDTPVGPWLVGAVGVGLAGAGVAVLRHLRNRRYFDDLRPLPSGTARAVSLVAVTGITAKAGIYGLAGAFLVRAALEHETNSGVGLDGALSTVAQQPYGTYVLAAAAGGLAAYAVWCWVRARYENVERSDG